MTICQTDNRVRSLSPRSVSARDFHFFDHSKISPVPSILRKKNKMRYTKYRAMPEDRLGDASPISSKAQSLHEENPSSCHSPSEKILKIIMPNDLEVPLSFSPPSNKLPMKKTSHEYRAISCDNGSARATNSVRFHSKVLVMRIPSRRQYPEPIRRSLWCSLSEIARSAHRNTIEFCSEGWDWRSAVEEDSMYIHPKTGRHIHPVHVQRAAAKTSTTPDVDKQRASARNEEDSEMKDEYNTEIAHAQVAHE